MQSTKYNLNKEDGIKILKVFGWVMTSTAVSFLITLLPQLELGSIGWLIPTINILLVTIQKFIKDNNYAKQ